MRGEQGSARWARSSLIQVKVNRVLRYSKPSQAFVVPVRDGSPVLQCALLETNVAREPDRIDLRQMGDQLRGSRRRQTGC